MANFSVWAPVVGEAVAQAAQGLEDVYDPLSARNQQRRQAASQQYLLPLETQARQRTLQQQIRAFDQPTFHPFAGGYALVYPDGRVEPHAWPAGVGGKQTAATRKLQELAQLAQSDDPLVANAAKGELSRFAHAGDPKDLQVLQKYMAMQRGELPYDQATDEYMQQKYREYQAKIPERGLAPLPSPTMPQVQGGAPRGEPAPSPAPPVRGTPSSARDTSLTASYQQYFTRAGEPYATEVVTRMVEADPQAEQRRTQLALAGYGMAYPGPHTIGDIQIDFKPQGGGTAQSTPGAAQFPTARQFQGAGITPPAAAPPTATADPQVAQFVPEIQKQFEILGPEKSQQEVEKFRQQGPTSPLTRAAEQAYTAQFGRPPPGAPGQARPGQMAAPTAQAPLLQGRQGQSPRYTAQTVVEQARALGFGHQEIAAAQQLFPYKAFSDLTAEDVKQVRQTVEAIKDDKAFRQVFKQAAPLIGELNSLDESAKMAEEIAPDLTPEHVGTVGWLNRKKQSLLYLNPKLAQQMHIKYDPAFQRIDTFAHIIGNVHANAVKRLGAGGGGRSAIKYDVESVTRLFDPYGWTTSAEDAKAALASIQEVIKLARPFVENDLRVLGVDPKTKGPMARNYGGIVIPEAETPAPQTAPQESEGETTGNDLLGRD